MNKTPNSDPHNLQRFLDAQDPVYNRVEMEQRNPTSGCPRIAQQINLAFRTSINKDVVRLVLDCSMRFSEHCVLIHAANSCANDTRNLKLLDLNCDCR